MTRTSRQAAKNLGGTAFQPGQKTRGFLGDVDNWDRRITCYLLELSPRR